MGGVISRGLPSSDACRNAVTRSVAPRKQAYVTFDFLKPKES